MDKLDQDKICSEGKCAPDSLYQTLINTFEKEHYAGKRYAEIHRFFIVSNNKKYVYIFCIYFAKS